MVALVDTTKEVDIIKTTTPHTLEERYLMEQHLNVELLQDIMELEKELENIMAFYPVSGEIEGVEAKDIKVQFIDNLVVATGKSMEDDSFIFTVIDLTTGNMTHMQATKPSQKPCVSIWQEDMEHATLFSTQLALDFQDNKVSKDAYKKMIAQLHKYHEIYQ